MSKEGKDKPFVKNAVKNAHDLLARIEAYQKKDISLTQFPMLLSNRKVLAQNMKNFTDLYGSRWEAIKKMDAIIGGNIKKR
jgi:hypothetical protein